VSGCLLSHSAFEHSMHEHDQDQYGLELKLLAQAIMNYYFAYAFSLTTEIFVNIYTRQLCYGFVGGSRDAKLLLMLLILFECFQTSHQGLLFSMVSNHKNDI
jgi:hypothetical protein